MRRTRRGAAAIFGTVALSIPGALLGQQRGAPPQRGSPPGQDTPYILVTAFRAPTKQLAVEGADELRDRLKSEHSAKELFVITKTSVEGTLTASGYPVDSALNVSDLMELAKTMRGEYVMDVTLKSTGGKAVHVEPRVLMKTGQQTIAQPLPAIDGKDVGDAAKQIEKSISEALKQIPMYKECIAALRGGKWDDAAAKARAGIAAYAGAAWSRVCLLNAYANAKTAPSDSIIAVGNAILAVDSTSMLALANLADAYKAKGELDKAVATYSRMAQLDPSNKSLIVGIIQEFGEKAPEKALPLISAELKENPGDTLMLRLKFAVEIRLNQFKSAIATGEEMIKADPKAGTLEFYNRLIGVAQSDSNVAAVADLAGKAAEKFPKDASFPTLLAQSYRKQNKLPEAMSAAKKAIEIEPKNTNAWLFAVLLANDQNQPDSAIALAKQGVAAGADRAQLGQAATVGLGSIVKRTQATNTRADWSVALKAAQEVDGFAASPQTKFFVGVSSFSIAADALSQLNELQKKKETYAQGCDEVKIVEDNFATASIAMPAGGSVDAPTATKILGMINEYGKYLPQFKTTMKCK